MVRALNTSPLNVEMLTGLILSRSCVRNHSCCELMSTEVLSYLNDTVLSSRSQLLAPKIFPPSLLQWSLSLRVGCEIYISFPKCHISSTHHHACMMGWTWCVFTLNKWLVMMNLMGKIKLFVPIHAHMTSL